MKNINKIEKYCDNFYKLATSKKPTNKKNVSKKQNRLSSKSNKPKSNQKINPKLPTNKPKPTTPTPTPQPPPQPPTQEKQKTIFDQLHEKCKDAEGKLLTSRKALTWKSSSGEIKEMVPYITDCDYSTKVEVRSGALKSLKLSEGMPIHCLLVWFIEPGLLREYPDKNFVNKISTENGREEEVKSRLVNADNFYVKDLENTSGVSFHGSETNENYRYPNPVLVIPKEFYPGLEVMLK